MLSISFDDIYVYIMVLARMAGVITFNPILTQRGVPAKIRTALAMLITLIMAPTVLNGSTYDSSVLGFTLDIFQELFVGFMFSYVISTFYYLILGAGEVIDIQSGLNMAMVFDPGTNIQMAISDKILNMFFIMYFFLTNSHLVMFKMISYSYNIIPPGVDSFDYHSAALFGTDVFISTFSLVMRLTFPFIAAHFILQICLGVLMKLIPQIHVFVINMELKVLLTILLLIVFAKPMANFVDSYIVEMLKQMQNSMFAITGE